MMRVGLGYGAFTACSRWRLVPGTVWLGNVAVPAPYRLIAHSDGDVVLHAFCDAMLGAVAAGDIGEWFPDTDAAHKGQDSAELLAAVMAVTHLLLGSWSMLISILLLKHRVWTV